MPNMFLPTACVLALTACLVNGGLTSDSKRITFVEDKFCLAKDTWTADSNGVWGKPKDAPYGGRIPNFKYAAYIPDGHFWAFRNKSNDATSRMIIGLNYDFRMESPTQYIEDGDKQAGGNVTEYAKTHDDVYPWQHGNYVTRNQTIETPPASVTGLRRTSNDSAKDIGDGYDQGPFWLKNVFRLSETSMKTSPDSWLIGFSHNEDYWGQAACATWKSIGVRYSYDAGLSWTRSVPILTKGTQPKDPFTGHEGNWCPMSGTGDFAAMWNPRQGRNGQWQIFTSEPYAELNATTNQYVYQGNRLVLATTEEPEARPGSWKRIEPVSNKPSRSGFDTSDVFSAETDMRHRDLTDFPGRDPSIIYDNVTAQWHMVYMSEGPKGSGLAYTRSDNGLRWTYPFLLKGRDLNSYGGPWYPSLIGNMGDTRTTNGQATLYYRTTEKTTCVDGDWRSMRSINLAFPM